MFIKLKSLNTKIFAYNYENFERIKRVIKKNQAIVYKIMNISEEPEFVKNYFDSYPAS